MHPESRATKVSSADAAPAKKRIKLRERGRQILQLGRNREARREKKGKKRNVTAVVHAPQRGEKPALEAHPNTTAVTGAQAAQARTEEDTAPGTAAQPAEERVPLSPLGTRAGKDHIYHRPETVPSSSVPDVARKSGQDALNPAAPETAAGPSGNSSSWT